MLELKNITKTYDMGEAKVEALKGISLNFRQSEFVSILGASGCGKTTLLNIVGGLDKYTSGDLVIDGKSTKQFKDSDWDTYRNHKIGFVFQSYNLIQHLSVLENVEMALSLTGISKKERKEKATDALSKVGLSDQLNKMPNQLSGGQMQRVAIARAIVNNPSIILADEPTGALDTKTSKQIMEILKQISADKLIIMVTHNAKLAKKYSTRIIKLSDGEVCGDNLPYEPTQQQNSLSNELTIQSKQKNKKSSLNFWSAMYLSLKNLLTKKGRTFLTSFAGSIGIIGVALVLAISNGFTMYINNLQQDTLSGYPVSVATATVDFASLNMQEIMNTGNKQKVDDAITVTGDLSEYIQYGHYNCINQNFIDYVKDFEAKNLTNNPNSNFSHIEYNYYAPTKFLIKKSNGSINFVYSPNSISLMSGSNYKIFYPELSDSSFIYQSYDVVYTADDYDASNMYGLTLVLNKGNKISYSMLQSLGLTLTRDAETNKYNPVSFKDICDSVQIKLMYNNQYYEYDGGTDTFTVKTQAEINDMFDDASLSTLKITRIIAPKEDSNTSLLQAGVMYTNALHESYLQNCENSLIAQKQTLRKLSEEGTNNQTFYVPFKIDVNEVPNVTADFNLIDTNSIIQFVQSFYKCTITQEEAYQMGMQSIGTSTIPQSIVFYPKNFEAKKQVSKMIDDYNLTVDKAYQIVYTDSSEFLTNTLGAMINVISIVLIAFAGISLVVSSIMIGIITYVSVIERTKEIGILRSLGARKQDISRIFNAETIIIGLLAGLIGVAVTYLFCPLINIIVSGLAGVSGIANFNPFHAVVLIIISMALTLISGSIPSRIASKKDPVECLRTE